MKKHIIKIFLLFFLTTKFVSGQNLMTEDQKNEFLRDLVSSFETEYLWVEKGKEIAKALQMKIDKGDYAKLHEAEYFVETLNRDLFILSQDRHLTIDLYKPKAENSTPVSDQKNKAIFKKEHLEDGIYYLKFDVFPRLDENVEKEIEEIMTSFKKINTLIIDLRDNNGGSDKTVNFLAGYFFENKTKLATSYQWNREAQEIWALPKKSSEILSKAKLIILTSQATFSAAEIFTQRLQSHKKASVMGESTFGAAHRTATYLMSDIFLLHWPYESSKHAINGQDLEGIGISPDYAVHYNEAKEAAFKFAKSEKFLSSQEAEMLSKKPFIADLLKLINSESIDQNFISKYLVPETKNQVLETLEKFKTVWNPKQTAKLSNIHFLDENRNRLFIQTAYGIVQMKVFLKEGKIHKIMYRL